MRTDSEYKLTPLELSQTFESMTMSQQLQFEAIMKMISSLLISVRMASQTEDKHNLIKKGE
ncbi:MAG: hypothetical protein K2J47_00605 [Ruminococcus sp.]|nr:hypothetical protein [Ruminococcus sp.]